MKCGAQKNLSCMVRSGDQCMEHLISDTPSCKSRIATTNADRIRSMGDEELAKIITAEPMAECIQFCKNLPRCDIDLEQPDGIPQERCVQCALDWLRQPAKEETE